MWKNINNEGVNTLTVLSEFIAKHPRGIIIAIALTLLISGYYASQIKIGVDTGRFELKNHAYQDYKEVLRTFGSEDDSVIVVCVSRDGSILHKGDIVDALRVEEKIDENTNVTTMQSPMSYIATGMHLLDFLKNLPENITFKIDHRVFVDMQKLRDVVSNYEYISQNGNESARNDSYRVFMLLPAYTNDTFAFMPGDNFTYAHILNSSKYEDTLYNSTTMLLDEMELYQNVSKYSAGTGSIGIYLPEHYDLGFLNESIDNLEFSVVRDDIGMEHYNTTYFEWYSYNFSFSMGLSLLYSGRRDLALGVYSATRDIVLNSTRAYGNDERNWSMYGNAVKGFMEGNLSAQELVNRTEYMENRSFGTLRDFLKSYRDELENYENSTVKHGEIMKWSNRTLNVTNLMLNYTSYSRNIDMQALPILNGTISDIIENRGFENATRLSRMSVEIEREIMGKIAYFYGEKMLYKKVLDVLTNLRSILMRGESAEVKQDAWELLGFYSNSTLEDFNVTPFHNALSSYRNWIYTNLSENFTAMLWDYLSLEPFDMNYTYDENVTFDMSYSYGDMIDEMQNRTQDEIDHGYESIRHFSNDTVENKIGNYTSDLNHTMENLTELHGDLNYLIEKYRTIGGADAENLTALFEDAMGNVTDGMRVVNESTDSVYSLREIEDFFSMREMYFNTLISRDQLSSLIIIGVLNSDEEMKIYHTVKDMHTSISLHTLSSRVLVKQIEKTATEDIKTFLPLSLLFLVILLYLTYRSMRSVALSFVAVLITLTWLMAFMVLIGWDFDPILLAVPIMIVGIGIDDGIYVTLRYMEERRSRSRMWAARVTVASVGAALILTTITSITGFLSNTLSSMEDIRRFGILAAMGLLFSFIVMNTFLPAANMLLDSRKTPRDVKSRYAQVGARIALRNPYIAISIAIIVSVAGIMAFQHINTEFNMKDLAPQNTEIVEFYHYYQRNFNATVEISYIYFEGNATSPEVLKAMAEVQKNIEDDRTVIHHYPVISPWSIMEDHAHARRGEYGYNATFIRLFHESDTDGDGIPDRNISALYSMLEPDISAVMKGNRSIFIVHTDSQDLKRVNELVNELRVDAGPLERYGRVEVVGDAIVGKASLDELNNNQLRSLALSVVFAVSMLIILFFLTKRSVTLGIIAAIPILLVVTWNWLLMYVLGISLNVMTNTIASLCVGLGVDYGIHITHRFVEETRKFYSISRAILNATGNLGRGMLGASATTISAIGILALSDIPPLSNFALILSFSILFSFLSAIIVLPSLLVIWARYRRTHGYDRVHREVMHAMKTGDLATLCRYSVSDDYCLLHLRELIKSGKIREARELSSELMERGIDTRSFFRGGDEFNPPFE